MFDSETLLKIKNSQKVPETSVTVLFSLIFHTDCFIHGSPAWSFSLPLILRYHCTFLNFLNPAGDTAEVV